MSNSEIPSDFFGINDYLKKIGDAWNEGLELTKRQSECKTRRFQLVRHGAVKASGVVFPSDTVVVQSTLDLSLSMFNNIGDFNCRYIGDIQWIDAEPEGSK